jgi:copper chaperone CopZ
MNKIKIGKALMLLVGAVVLSISLAVAKNSGVLAGDASESSFRVSNLSCGSCLGTIEQELRKYDGMVNMKADLGLGLVTIGHTAALPALAIAAVITEAGYPARVLSVQEAELLQGRAASGGAGNAGVGCGGCGAGGCGLPQQYAPPQG